MSIIRVKGLRGMLRDEGLVGACIARCISGVYERLSGLEHSMGKRGTHRHGVNKFQVYMHVHHPPFFLFF